MTWRKKVPNFSTKLSILVDPSIFKICNEHQKEIKEVKIKAKKEKRITKIRQVYLSMSVETLTIQLSNRLCHQVLREKRK